ncbi:MAG TPA: TIGR03089 family protein [Mycobacteriales bacterium]
MPGAPQTAPALLAARLRADPATPLVTYYDDATGERTELSAATFDNWVAKTANLLVDGIGTGRGDRAVVALPLHWQALVVVAGCWAAGLTVAFEGPGEVGFAAGGDPRPDADDTVVLSLRPLGAGLTTPEPDVTDYAVEVRAYGDRFTGAGPTADDEALPGVSHRTLSAGAGSDARVLLAPAGDPPLDAGWLRRAYLDPLAGRGSVVLCRHLDRALLARRLASERAVPPPAEM